MIKAAFDASHALLQLTFADLLLSVRPLSKINLLLKRMLRIRVLNYESLNQSQIMRMYYMRIFSHFCYFVTNSHVLI